MKKCEQKKDDDKMTELFSQVRNIPLLSNSEFLSEMYLKDGLLARLLPYYRDFVSGRNVYPVVQKCVCPCHAKKKRKNKKKYIIIANIIILILFLLAYIIIITIIIIILICD